MVSDDEPNETCDQLMVCDATYRLSAPYTGFTILGTVPTHAALPDSAANGDACWVGADGMLMVYTDGEWLHVEGAVRVDK